MKTYCTPEMKYVLLAVKNVLESSVNEDFIDFDYGATSLGGQE